MKGNKKAKKKRKQPDQVVERDIEEPKQNGKDSEEGPVQPDPKDDRPLEVRVSQMAINSKEGSRNAGIPVKELDLGGGQIKRDQLNADSAVVLLSQALQSGDKQLLEQCLQVRQEQVISNTVKQLRSDQVGKLVPLLVERINTSSTRAMQVACWVRHVVRQHLTYIISAPSMKRHLSVLYQHLEERQSSHGALLGLHGRLELLTTYIKATRQQRAESAKESTLNGGATDYYSDPAVVHVHESDEVEVVSLVPQLDTAALAVEEQESDDEDMEDAESSEEERIT